MRSTSIATASTACSIRSSRFSTFAESAGATGGRSTKRRVNAFNSGMPSAMTAIVMKNDWTISTTSWGMNPGGNGPIGPCRMNANTLGIACPFAAGHRKHESNDRAVSGRALRRDRAAMREHRLSCDRQAEAGAAGFRGNVRLPDLSQILLRDAAAAVRDGDLYAAGPTVPVSVRMRAVPFDAGDRAERPHAHRDLGLPPVPRRPARVDSV